MEPLEQLTEWGYRVEKAQEHDGFDVYFVEGFGLASYVRDDDEEALANLADPAAHAERVQQQGETSDETQLRWVDEGRIELDDDALKALRERVAQQVSAE